jgi:hypothetical protein
VPWRVREQRLSVDAVLPRCTCPAVRLACLHGDTGRHVESGWRRSFVIVVELLEHLLDLVELVLGLLDDLLQAL